MPAFSALSLSNWRQFRHVSLDLSAQTTVLTGANGCGKTTILNILSSHFGWNMSFVSTPFIGKKRFNRFYSDRLEILEAEEPTENADEVGSITYDNSTTCRLLVPEGSQNTQYHLQYTNKMTLDGLHIPSHRPSITFQKVDQLPTNPKTNQQQYQEFVNLLQQTYSSASVRNPGLILKQSLISLALFGYGNDAVVANPEYRMLFEGFQSALRHVLPANLGFRSLEVRMPDVVLLTDTGTFALDAMSGGINSLFGITWQIFMYCVDKSPCTVVIDEPENHLHPSMQRTLLPSLEKAFPNNRFIIATHSPFIVTSNQHANVYALSQNDRGNIESTLLDKHDLSATPNRVLREILDVPTTTPVWVDEAVRQVLQKYDNVPDSEEKIDVIAKELSKMGIEAESLW